MKFNKLFTVVALLSATTMTLIAQTTNPYAPEWTKKGYYFTPNAENTESTLTITARVTIDEVPCDSAYEIGVFVGDRCVARNNIYSSEKYYERHGYYTTLNVKANRNDVLSFRIYDHRNNVEVKASGLPETIKFVPDDIYGFISSELYKITFNGSTTHRTTPLKFDDDTDFTGNQYCITAEGIECSYNRNAYLDGGYESIVLPFAADITDMKKTGFVFEKMEAITENSIRFVELAEDENLTAGVAYIFKYTGTPSNERMNVTFAGKHIQITDAIENNNGWTGTFNRMDGSMIAGKYILNIQGDKMQKASEKASLAPYRAYLELPQNINPANIRIIHKKPVTSIANIEKDNIEEKNVYDLNGRILMDKQYKGLVIRNNKIVFVK